MRKWGLEKLNKVPGVAQSCINTQSSVSIKHLVLSTSCSAGKWFGVIKVPYPNREGCEGKPLGCLFLPTSVALLRSRSPLMGLSTSKTHRGLGATGSGMISAPIPKCSVHKSSQLAVLWRNEVLVRECSRKKSIISGDLQNVHLMRSDKRVFFLLIFVVGERWPIWSLYALCEEENKWGWGNTTYKRTNRAVWALMIEVEHDGKFPAWANRALSLGEHASILWWSQWTPIPLWSACLPPKVLLIRVHPLTCFHPHSFWVGAGMGWCVWVTKKSWIIL